ncbi:MAG TPA: polysaccharide biosynthesis tyrosine autokinase [Vicinamibacterales bacterium]|nr:polysaccharide biosynthesis tyrosine autokinase [Vicinamibacterales bacterium]
MPPLEPADAQGAASPATGRPADDFRARVRSRAPRSGDDSLVAYLGVVQKRRWLAAGAFLAVVLPALLWVLASPSIYEARARLMIEPTASTPIAFGDSRTASDALSPRALETQYEVLRNRALAQRTIEELKLWQEPAFTRPDDPLSPGGAFRRAQTAVRRLLGGSAPPAAAQAAPADQASPLVDALLARLSVRPIENSRLVDIVFQSQDPALAAKVANALARLAIDQDLESRYQSARHASEWLEKRLSEQRAAVDASEAALQKYREEHGAVALDDRQNIVVQKLADLNAALTRAKTDRLAKEGLYTQLAALQGSQAALDTFPLILSNPYIQQLKAQVADLQKEHSQLAERYGERYPEMVRVRMALQAAESRLQSEIAKTVEAVRNDYLAAQAQERSLTAALEAQKRQALDLGRVGIEYGSLERDAASNRQVLDSLLQQAKQTGLVAAVSSSNLRVVEAAVRPTAPVRPQRGRSLFLSLLGAAVLALGLVFGAELADTRLKSPEEIRAYLDLPSLGLIPAVESKVLDHEMPLVGKRSSADFNESMRRLRTGLMLAAAKRGATSIAITSTSPQEGKTAMACNLAVVLAQADRHVLLVDADMRRPQVHEIFGLRQQPGLSEVLASRAHPGQSICRGVERGLDVLPSGEAPPNPAELLILPLFRQLIERAGSDYDYVIIDCPPVMAVTDATLIADAVSGVVFVVGADATARGAAQAALGELDSSDGKILGAVLNRVQLRRNRYYYARYYNPEYERYYRQG